MPPFPSLLAVQRVYPRGSGPRHPWKGQSLTSGCLRFLILYLTCPSPLCEDQRAPPGRETRCCEEERAAGCLWLCPEMCLHLGSGPCLRFGLPFVPTFSLWLCPQRGQVPVLSSELGA